MFLNRLSTVLKRKSHMRNRQETRGTWLYTKGRLLDRIDTLRWRSLRKRIRLWSGIHVGFRKMISSDVRSNNVSGDKCFFLCKELSRRGHATYGRQTYVMQTRANVHKLSIFNRFKLIHKNTHIYTQTHAYTHTNTHRQIHTHPYGNRRIHPGAES